TTGALRGAPLTSCRNLSPEASLRTNIVKKGKDTLPSPFFGYQNRGKVNSPLLGFSFLVLLFHRRSARRLVGGGLHFTTRCRRFSRRWRCWSRRWRRRGRWSWLLLFTASCKREHQSEEGCARQEDDFLSHS